MKLFVNRGLFVISFLFFGNFIVLAQSDLPADKIFEAVNNSVVVVISYDKDTNENQGSGVVINNMGYIVTNYHVCDDAVKIEVKHYNTVLTGVDVIFKDADRDIMILKVSDEELKPIKIGTVKNVKPGQRVYAIGSPEGYENSISDGIVSGFRLDDNNMNLIQMTTPITDGSSGGAVVNARGELIGLSVSGQHDGNLYFAIPVDEIINDLNNNKVNADINEPENFLAEGDKASKKDDYEDAIYYFSKYLEKNHDADVFFRRGYANMKLKKYKQAISDFSSSIPVKSDMYELYFYRANCYYAIRDYKNSINDYSRAIDLAPQFAEFYYNRGYAYYKLKMLEDCMKDWQTAVEANQDYSAELNPLISKIKTDIDNGN